MHPHRIRKRRLCIRDEVGVVALDFEVVHSDAGRVVGSIGRTHGRVAAVDEVNPITCLQFTGPDPARAFPPEGVLVGRFQSLRPAIGTCQDQCPDVIRRFPEDICQRRVAQEGWPARVGRGEEVVSGSWLGVSGE